MAAKKKAPAKKASKKTTRKKAPAKKAPARKKAPAKKAAKKKTAKKKVTHSRAAKPGKKPGKGSKGGRPKLVVDLELLTELASISCTDEEIAHVLGISVDTLTRRFAEPLKKAKDHGKASLRRVQMQNALAGNATMQIWLGKQLLGQKDVIVQEHVDPVTEVKRTIIQPPDYDADD